MAEEKQDITVDDGQILADSWNPFEGLGKYDEGDNDPIPADIKQAIDEPKQDSKPSQKKETQEPKEERQEETVKGGHILDDLFADMKEEDAEIKKAEGEDETANAPGRQGPYVDPRVEQRQINALFDVFVDEYGWGDIPKEERPRNAEEFVEYVNALIDTNAVPQYAHPELQKLDEYVRNGGDLGTYMKTMGEIDYTNVAITNEYDAQLAVAQLLRAQGYDEQTIGRKITNYTQKGVLLDEAQDALDILAGWSQMEKQNRLIQAQQQRQAEAAAQNEYMTITAKALMQAPDILGVKLNDRERRELFQYMFRPTKNGESQFSQDYSSNPYNLITAAFITRYGDQALSDLRKKSEKRAIDKFRETIARQNVNNKQQAPRRSGKRQMWDAFNI